MAKFELISTGQYIQNRFANSEKELLSKIVEWIDFSETGDELTIKVLNEPCCPLCPWRKTCRWRDGSKCKKPFWSPAQCE